MAETYSRRLLSPYTSPVQIADIGEARALSIDGINWELQYLAEGSLHRPGINQADASTPRYACVATIENSMLEIRPLHSHIDAAAVTGAIERLAALVAQASLPFAAIDSFEYWLLDQDEAKPLALLRSCASAAEMTERRERPEWLAMPAAQLEIENIETDASHYVAPINRRLEVLIGERAGLYPKAAWFDRSQHQEVDFPPCLVSENWQDEQEREICRRYIRRLAPRLLMLQGLPRADRQRLEQAASEFAIDVERFYALYPEVIDEKLMTALRVEAKMRLAARPAPR